MQGSLAELLKPQFFTFLGQGLLTTLEIAISSILISFVFGTALGVLRYTRHPVFGRLAGFYVEAIRNSPLILIILVMRFMSGLEPVTSGIAAMSIFTTAVLAEIVRGGLNAVDRGQWESAKAQGFTFWQTLRHIVLPQALRRMIPPMASQFITVIKDTSFVWIVGVEDLTGKGMIILGQHSSTVQFFAVFGTVALIYWLICRLLSFMAQRLERQLAW